jgi:hypothetical protein
MIEKRPYWQEPGFDADKKGLVESEILAEFPSLIEYPHYVGSHLSSSFQENLTPQTYTYIFSDGSREEFELEFQDTHPSGDLVLEASTTEGYLKNFLSVQKISEELFLVSYVPRDYSYLASGNEDSEVDGDSEIEYGEDWSDTAADDSAFYYENKRQREQAEEYRSSEFREVYEDAVKKRNLKVDEIAFDRTHPEIYLSLKEQLPDFKSAMSQAPSYKSGQFFTRHFLFDHVPKKHFPPVILGETITTSDIGIWQAGMLRGKPHSLRNQPIAYIKPNGRILWESREDRYCFTLEILAILQELIGENESAVNREKLDLVIYEPRGTSEGNIFIVRASSKDLATSIAKTINSKFGSPASKLNLVLEPDSGIYKGSNENLEISLYGKPDPHFASEFMRVRDDLAI